MSITLSDSAAARVNTFLANRGKGFGLRLGVRTSGCSGMAYVLEFVDEPAAEDTVFEDKLLPYIREGLLDDVFCVIQIFSIAQGIHIQRTVKTAKLVFKFLG